MAAAKLEDLAVGGLLPTGFGGIRPIQWIARHSARVIRQSLGRRTCGPFDPLARLSRPMSRTMIFT